MKLFCFEPGKVLFLLAAVLFAGAPDTFAVSPFGGCATGVNLIANGNAETDSGLAGTGGDHDLTAWNPETGAFTAVRYNVTGYPTTGGPGPTDRGTFFFAGGNAAASSGTQLISISDCSDAIDAGIQRFSMSGYFGGFSDHDDNARMTVNFLSEMSVQLGTATVGPVMPGDRANVTGLFPRASSGFIPAGTRTVQVVLSMQRAVGTANDGYADNLSFMMSVTSASPANVTGQVRSTDGRGISGARVTFTDPDGSQRFATTNSFGYYTVRDLPAGQTYAITTSARRYVFDTQVVTINENLDSLDIVALQ